jgi:dolichol-phosphate mannosyltransferase
VRDAASGYFLIRRDLAQGVQISAGGFKICLELLVRGRATRIVEVPYVFEDRAAGESKMNLKEALGYLVQLRDLYRFTRQHPRVEQQYTRLTPEQLQAERLLR